MYASSYDSSGAKGRDQGMPYPAAPMPMGIAVGEGQPCPPLSHFNGASVVGRRTGPWSTGLCHCCDDPANCLVTTFCPCITFGQIAELVNQGNPGCAANGTIYALLMGFTGLPCLYSCFYRPRLRAQYGLEESHSADCLVHFCCEPCALCQEYRELNNRGFDMGIGWEANMKRQKAGLTVAPPIGVMMR